MLSEGAGAFQAPEASLDKDGFSHGPLVCPAEDLAAGSKGNRIIISGLKDNLPGQTPSSALSS